MSIDGDSTTDRGTLAYPETPLTDGNVALRRWQADDLPLVERACRDPRLLTGTSLPRMYTTAAGAAFIERQLGRERDGEGLSLVITRRNRPVGCATLMTRRPFVADLGYWLVSDARGVGTGSRAVSQLVAWALRQPAIDAVEAFVADENVASRRLLETIGFRYAGRAQHQVNDLHAELRVYRNDRPLA